jgi:hypothetical protein
MDRRVPLRRGKRPVEQLAVLAHLHHVLALQGACASSRLLRGLVCMHWA